MSLNFDSTTQEYVEVIYEIQKSQKVARVKDIADRRGVTKASVSTALNLLKKKGLVAHETYGLIELTSRGKKLARELDKSHKIIKDFFINILNVDSDTANEDACRLEHHISKDVLDSFVKFMTFMKSHPKLIDEWLNIVKISN